MLREKRAAWKKGQKSQAPLDKQTHNRLTEELKQLRNTKGNSSVQQYSTNLTPTAETNYSLWKATRKLKRPQQHIPPICKADNTWARYDIQKADTFAEHLETVFRPHPASQPSTSEITILPHLTTPYQMATQVQKIRVQEVENIETLIPEMKEREWKITLRWVKAHAGIRGNEEADTLAQSTAINNNIPESYNTIPKSVVMKDLEKISAKKW
jgi:hypothetical protein